MRIRKDIARLVLLCILVAVNYLYLIPVQVVEEGSDPVYPLLLNGILAFLLIFYALELLRSRRKLGISLVVWQIYPRRAGKVILLLALVWGWAEALNHLGFIVPTMCFLGLSVWLYGERSWSRIVLVMVVSPVLLYILFVLFGSYLPQGPLEQYIGRFLVR